MALSAFEVAAKHLFRHLHDPAALRKNPIVGHLFGDFRGGTVQSIVSARAVLRELHDQIRDIAASLRDDGGTESRAARAQRGHIIVTEQILGRRPIAQVAAKLGISTYHCYRERAMLCRRLARELVAVRAAARGPETSDDFQLLTDYVRHRAVYANSSTAISSFEELVALAPTPTQKVEALRAAASRAIGLGELTWADWAYATASEIAKGDLMRFSVPVRQLAYANIDLLGYELAMCRGQRSKALAFSRSAAQRLEPLARDAAAGELYADCLLAVSTACWILGEINRAYDFIRQVDLHLRAIDVTSLSLRARARASLWKARNYLLLQGEAYYPSAQRLEGLLQAFREAYRSGSMTLAIDILVLLIEHHEFTGNGSEALRTARFAMFLAKQHSPASNFQVALEVAVRLLPTRYSRFALDLVSATHRPQLDAYHRRLLSYFEAESLLRRRSFDEALVAATQGQTKNRWATIEVRRHLVAARAADQLERTSQALSLVEQAVGMAERLQAAPLLRDAYRVAKQITGEQRFARQEAEIVSLFVS
jgi:hypothetical protein